MKEFEVTCVTKPDRYSAHEHITHIGNIAGQWRITRELAIRKIDSKEEAFYKKGCQEKSSPSTGGREDFCLEIQPTSL